MVNEPCRIWYTLAGALLSEVYAVNGTNASLKHPSRRQICETLRNPLQSHRVVDGVDDRKSIVDGNDAVLNSGIALRFRDVILVVDVEHLAASEETEADRQPDLGCHRGA
jgi:hypothetical protein